MAVAATGPQGLTLPRVALRFADMPRGELRDLACSMQVPPQTLDKINQAIRELLLEALAD